MQLSRSVFWFIIAVVVLCMLVLWHKRKQSMPTSTIAVIETNTIPPAETTLSPIIHTNVVRINQPIVTTNVPSQPPKNDAERVQEVLSAYNNVPIDFYGKLEDQFSNAISGAEIRGNVQVISGTRQATDWLTTTSDINGQFQFHGTGQNIGLMPFKPGYALATTTTLFKYSLMEDHPYVSDENNPTVIPMWKLQGAEPLLNINQQYKLQYTPTPIYFDLLAGQTVPEGGDIKMTVDRPTGVVSGNNPQDWSLKIEVVNGGLLDSGGQEAVTYEAPASGYQSGETFLMSISSNTWYQAIHPGFFFTSRSGQVYGKLGVSFHINAEPTGVMTVGFGGVANTNGSRNLEGDPNTMNAATK
jgi:hypothetical protein